VRIYNRALTASDVAALYQAGSHRTTSESGFSKMLFPPIDQSVAGWWKLNDAAGQTIVKDWTANANTGTSANNIISATGYTGVANTAMSFNGTSDYVSVADNTNLRPGTSSVSYSAWFKTIDSEGEIIWKGTISPTNYYRVGVETNKIVFTMWTGQGHHFHGNTNVNNNVWHHVVAVRNENIGTIYLDGVSDGTQTTTA